MESILIVGTGALACYYGARLSANGIKVSILGNWEAGLNALKTAGIRLVDKKGEEAYPVQVLSHTEDDSLFDHALVLVKAWQTGHAAKQLAQFLSPHGVALTLQNGLGNKEALAAELGDERVLQGTTTTGATLVGPGQVRPGGEGVITLPVEDENAPLQQIFKQAGFSVETTNDLQSLLWKKLIVNVGINPLTALLEIPNGILLQNSYAWDLSCTLAEEAAQTAMAAGVNLDGVNPIRLVRTVAEKTAANHSSMLQDMKRGAPTEIDAICGAVIQYAEKFRVDTPANRNILNLIKAKVETKQ